MSFFQDVVGGLIGGVGQAAGAAVSASANKQVAKANIKHSRGENKKARKFATTQAERAYGWQKSINRRAREFASHQAGLARGFAAKQGYRDRRFNSREARLTRSFARQERRASQRYNRKERQAAQNFSRLMDNTAIRRRVRDAQAAGIHPMFALGASMNYSPAVSASGYSVPASAHSSSGAPGAASAPVGGAPHGEVVGPGGLPGQALTGSAWGDAIAALSGDLGALLHRREGIDEVTKAKIRMYDAAAARDSAEAARAMSLQAREAQAVNHKRSSPQTTVKKHMDIPREKVEAKPYAGSVVTPLGRFGQTKTTNAERVEQEYGDLTGSVYGAWRALNDAGGALGRKVFDWVH